MTLAPHPDVAMARCGVLPPRVTMMTASGASVRTKVRRSHEWDKSICEQFWLSCGETAVTFAMPVPDSLEYYRKRFRSQLGMFASDTLRPGK